MRAWRRRCLIAMAVIVVALVGAWTLPQFFMSGRAVSLTGAYVLMAYYMFGTALALVSLLVLGIAAIVLTVRMRLTE